MLKISSLAILLASPNASADTIESEEPVVSVSQSVEEETHYDTNISMNPFYPLLGGGLQGSASFRIDKSLAIGPMASTFSLLGVRTNTIGVQGQYHLKKEDVMGKGLILDNGLEFTTTAVDAFGQSERYNAVLAHSSVNWQWVYDNGFNIRAGGGLAMQMAFDEDAGYDGISGFSAFSITDNLAGHFFISGKLSWAF